MNAKTLARDTANVTHAPARADELRSIDARVVAGLLALADGYGLTVRLGLTSAAELTKHAPHVGSPAQVAPMWNRGHKAAQVIGEAQTLQLIADAIALPKGAAYQKAGNALQFVCKLGEARAAEGKTGMVPAKSVAKVMRDAVKAAADALASKRANEGKNKGVGKGNAGKGKTPTAPAQHASPVNAAALTHATFAAAFTHLMTVAKTLPAMDESRAAAWDKTVADARIIAEKLTTLAGKPGKGRAK